MAAGDTISGQVRVVKVTQLGDQLIVAGPFSQTAADQANFDQRLHINVRPGVDMPFGGANIKQAPEAIFQPGEKVSVQHLSSNLEEAIDYDANEEEIDVLEKDLNTGIVQSRTLTVADTELTANPTSSKTVWTEFFRDTVPDRRRWQLRGAFKAAAVENA